MSRMSKLRARDAARDALKNKKREQWGCSLVSLLYMVHNPGVGEPVCQDTPSASAATPLIEGNNRSCDATLVNNHNGGNDQ